jgi:hypothetical protein
MVRVRVGVTDRGRVRVSVTVRSKRSVGLSDIGSR